MPKIQIGFFALTTNADGTINTNLDRTFKLEEAGKAHEYIEANKVSNHLFVSPSVACAVFIFILFTQGEALCGKVVPGLIPDRVLTTAELV